MGRIKKYFHKVTKRNTKPCTPAFVPPLPTSPNYSTRSPLGLDHQLGEVPPPSRNRSSSIIGRLSRNNASLASVNSHSHASPGASLGHASEYVAARTGRPTDQPWVAQLDFPHSAHDDPTSSPQALARLLARQASRQQQLIEQLAPVLHVAENHGGALSHAASTSSVASSLPVSFPSHFPVPAPRSSSLGLLVRGPPPPPPPAGSMGHSRNATLDTLAEYDSPEGQATSTFEDVIELAYTADTSPDIANDAQNSPVMSTATSFSKKLRSRLSKLAPMRKKRAIVSTATPVPKSPKLKSKSVRSDSWLARQKATSWRWKKYGEARREAERVWVMEN